MSHKGIKGLKAVKGKSLLGKHNGIMDDDLLKSLIEDMETRPTVELCELCGAHIRCAICGNNCCNGGTGVLADGSVCGCEEAYELQDKLFMKGI